MATIALRALSVSKTVHGNSPWTQTFPEAASQTFKGGAIVSLDANGRVIEAGTDPARVLGVAASDGANDSVAGNSQTTVWVADDETIFVGNLSSNAPTTTAQVDIGRGYGVFKEASTGTPWTVDKSDLTNRRVIVVDLDRRDAVGDTNGRVLFMFFSQFRALAYTS